MDNQRQTAVGSSLTVFAGVSRLSPGFAGSMGEQPAQASSKDGGVLIHPAKGQESHI